MPLYEYRCEQHGDFTRQADIAHRNNVVNCPTCGADTTRIISAPSLALMSDNNRKAWAKNEKSAHEPIRKKKHVCSSSCNHGHSAAEKKPEYMQAPAGGRPWMLGH